MTRALIVAAFCLLVGAVVGYWAGGSYAEHLASQLRFCESELDRARR